jgi:hypothetical protein
MDEGPQPLALFKANRQSKCEFDALPFFRSRALDQASRKSYTVSGSYSNIP